MLIIQINVDYNIVHSYKKVNISTGVNSVSDEIYKISNKLFS